MIRKTACPFLNSDNLLMKTEMSFIREVSKLNNILSVCLRRTDGCTGQTKWCRKEKMDKRRLTRYINTQVNVWFIRIYER